MSIFSPKYNVDTAAGQRPFVDPLTTGPKHSKAHGSNYFINNADVVPFSTPKFNLGIIYSNEELPLLFTI